MESNEISSMWQAAYVNLWQHVYLMQAFCFGPYAFPDESAAWTHEQQCAQDGNSNLNPGSTTDPVDYMLRLPHSAKKNEVYTSQSSSTAFSACEKGHQWQPVVQQARSVVKPDIPELSGSHFSFDCLARESHDKAAPQAESSQTSVEHPVQVPLAAAVPRQDEFDLQLLEHTVVMACQDLCEFAIDWSDLNYTVAHQVGACEKGQQRQNYRKTYGRRVSRRVLGTVFHVTAFIGAIISLLIILSNLLGNDSTLSTQFALDPPMDMFSRNHEPNAIRDNAPFSINDRGSPWHTASDPGELPGQRTVTSDPIAKQPPVKMQGGLQEPHISRKSARVAFHSEFISAVPDLEATCGAEWDTPVAAAYQDASIDLQLLSDRLLHAAICVFYEEVGSVSSDIGMHHFKKLLRRRIRLINAIIQRLGHTGFIQLLRSNNWGFVFNVRSP